MDIVDGRIKDFISEKWVKHTPEEEVRQIMLRRLCLEYGYPKDLIETEFPIHKGSKKIGPADIVVFKDNKDRSQHNLWIIIEVKRKERTDGIDQLKTYLAPCKGAKYGLWFNGLNSSYIQVRDQAPYFRKTLGIPRYGQDTLDLPKKGDLTPAVELMTVFQVCHNHIYANDGLLAYKVFNEVLKIIFLKMIDEKSSDPLCKFGISAEEEEEVLEGKESAFYPRIIALFKKVKKAYPDIFSKSEEITLKPSTLGFVVSQLQPYSLVNTSVDVKGLAFQAFVYAHQRGERGEFFTPASIVDLSIDILNPKDDELVCDPACGSAGFLISCMQHVWNRIDKNRTDLSEAKRQDLKIKYASDYVRGSDINPDLAKVAKMHMILYEDGHAGICSVDGLTDMKTIKSESGGNIDKGKFDVIVTNPPFGTKGKITDKNILKQFDLARSWKRIKGTDNFEITKKQQSGVVPDVLFIERCIELLDEGGRMAIVLPNGDLNNITLQYVRQYVMSKCRVLGVVSLPVGTFKSAGANPQSSVLFVQKIEPVELEKLNSAGYPIFMAVAEDVGYDLNVKSAPTIYWKKPNGELILDKNEDPIIATDLPKIVELFQTFLVNEKVSFISVHEIKKDPIPREVKSTTTFSKDLTDRLDGVYYSTITTTSKEFEERKLDVDSMENLVSFPKAKTPKRDEYTEVGIPVIKLKNIKDDFINLKGCDFVSPTVSKKYFSPQKNDILLTAAGEGTIGRACIITEETDCITTGEVMILRPNETINPYYLLYYLRSEIGKTQLIRFSRGSSGQTHLYSKDVKTMPVPILSQDEQKKFETAFKKADQLKQEMKRLLGNLKTEIDSKI